MIGLKKTIISTVAKAGMLYGMDISMLQQWNIRWT